MTDRLQDMPIIGLDEAAARFRAAIESAAVPEPQLFLDWCEQILVHHPERKALLLPAGFHLDGDLELDWSVGCFASGAISTLLAMGDLHIDGRLLNLDTEEAPFLLVAGGIRAQEIVKAASALVVLGSLSVDRLLLCDGDNGALLVGGDLTAGALIDCDHEIYVAGDVHAPLISDDMGNMRANLVVEVFEDPDDPSDEWPDGDLLRSRILEGLPVLKVS